MCNCVGPWTCILYGVLGTLHAFVSYYRSIQQMKLLLFVLAMNQETGTGVSGVLYYKHVCCAL